MWERRTLADGSLAFFEARDREMGVGRALAELKSFVLFTFAGEVSRFHFPQRGQTDACLQRCAQFAFHRDAQYRADSSPATRTVASPRRTIL